MFERFQPAAREAVIAARSEAAQMRHQYVGTEHLLLGLLADRPESEGRGDPASRDVAANVLAVADVHADYVRSEVTRLVGAGCSEELGESEADALQAIGIDLGAVRARLESSFGEGVLDQSHGGRPGGRMPLTPRAKRALELALRESRQLGHNHLGTEHILLGLIRDGCGVAAQILASKLALRSLRDRVLAELERAA